MRLLVAVVAVSLVAGASAAAPGTPDVSKMVLAPGEVPGSKVQRQGFFKDTGYVNAYQRTLIVQRGFGASHVVLIQSVAELAKTLAGAKSDINVLNQALRAKAGREAVAAQIVKQLGKKATRKDVGLWPTRNPHLGDASVELPLNMKAGGARVAASEVFFRVDRLVGVLILLAPGKRVAPADVSRLGGLMVQHMKAQLVPLLVAPPTITGTAQQGQTLTAAPGTWGNAPASFTYQWQKCDAAGANCAPIAGATTSTYVVQPTDVGSTIRVTVTAQNTYGTGTADSTQTAPVT